VIGDAASAAMLPWDESRNAKTKHFGRDIDNRLPGENARRHCSMSLTVEFYAAGR